MSIGLQNLNASLITCGGGRIFFPRHIFTVNTRCDTLPRILRPISFQGGSRIPVVGGIPARANIRGGVSLP
jgi:hypothetical protein